MPSSNANANDFVVTAHDTDMGMNGGRYFVKAYALFVCSRIFVENQNERPNVSRQQFLTWKVWRYRCGLSPEQASRRDFSWRSSILVRRNLSWTCRISWWEWKMLAVDPAGKKTWVYHHQANEANRLTGCSEPHRLLLITNWGVKGRMLLTGVKIRWYMQGDTMPYRPSV